MGHNDHIDFELNDMIDDLVDEGVLERGTPAFGIAQQAIFQGFDSLSAKQRSIYDSIVAPALVKREEELKMQQIMSSNPD